MSITAIFENGVFKPLEPVRLPERTRVTIQVPQEDSAALAEQVSQQWSLHLVEKIADDFESLPAGFEEYTQ